MSLGGTLLMIGVALTLASCALPGVATTTSPRVASPLAPLPQNSTLAQPATPARTGDQTWIYTVPNTDARKLEAFYRTALPSKGWTGYQAVFSGAGAGESVTITAQRTGQLVTITAGPGPIHAVAAPAGGVTLQLTESLMGI